MSREFELKSYEFRKERSKSWTELEKLVNRCEKKGPKSLTGKELARLPVLYRAALSSLSVAKSISLDRALLDYLEALTARAYFVVYRPKVHIFSGIGKFFSQFFPQAVRDVARPLLLSTLFLMVGVLTGFFMTVNDPSAYYAFVSPEMASGRGPDSSREELLEVLYGGDESTGSGLAYFAAFLFNNNASVGILAFALGGLVGIPVFLLLFQNGLTLGAFAAIHFEQGLTVDLWGWLLPHGVTEILAIVLCGAAGLAIARGILFPGEYGRIDAMRIEGKAAGTVVFGSLLLFVIAGLIEGIFRQKVQSIWIRYVLASVTAVFWTWYFCRCGRGTKA